MIKVTIQIVCLCFLCLFCSCSNTLVATKDFSFKLKGNHEVSIESNYIVIDSVDTIFYNRGFYLNTLTEVDPEIVYIPKMSDKEAEIKMLSKIDSLPHTEISRTRRFDLDKYRNQNVSFIPLRGFRAKLTYPREYKGNVGIYIDSLYYGCISDVCGNIEFNIYGVDVRQTMQESYIKAFTNMVFHLPTDSSKLPPTSTNSSPN